MANSKQKPVPEGSQRRPGKSKFAIPKREAPPIDGSYLDRLFADYDRQVKELEGQPAGTRPEAEITEGEQVTLVPPAEPAAQPQVVEAPPLEASRPRPSHVTFPFRPQDIVPAQPESPEAPSAGVSATDTPELKPAGVEDPTPSLIGTVVSVDDEPLLERWKKRHRLSKGEVKVLRVMVRLCRQVGGDYCYVKIPQLMGSAELKERQTQLVLRRLRELGIVEKVAEYSNADRMGTKYRVLFESE